VQQRDQSVKDSQGTAVAAGLDGTAKMDALNALGHFYLRHMQTDKAIILFRALHKLQPQNPRITLSLAYAHYLAGDPQEAATLSSPLLQQDTPLQRAASILYSRALIKLGRNKEARQILRQPLTSEEI